MDEVRFLRRSKVEELTGLSTSGIYRQIKAETFPRPVRTGPGSVAWKSDEVAVWMQNRERAGGATKAA